MLRKSKLRKRVPRLRVACRATFFWLLIALPTSASLAKNGFEYPPILQSPQEQQAYILNLLVKYPWLNTTQIPGHLPQYVKETQTWLGKLYSNPIFQELQPHRPKLLSIEIQKAKVEEKTELVLDEKFLPLILQEVKDVFSEKKSLSSISRKIMLLATELGELNPSNIVTGLVNLIDPGKRKKIFEMQSIGDQLDALEKESEFNNESVAQGFNPERVGLPFEYTKLALIVEKSRELARKQIELLCLIRASWFLISNEVEEYDADVEKKLENRKSQNFVPSLDSELSKKSSGFLEALQSSAGSPLLSKKGLATLSNAIAILQKKYHREILTSFTRYETQYVIQEVPPEIATYRGILGGDCATTNSYAFPYSPLERVFYIFNAKGEPVHAYLAGTLVTEDKKPTFYLHDLAGPGLTEDMQAQLVHAIYHSLDQIGAEQMTLATKTVLDANSGVDPNPGTIQRKLIDALLSNGGRQVRHSYHDAGIRVLLGSLPFSELKYDSPETNAFGNLFVPDANVVIHLKPQETEGELDNAKIPDVATETRTSSFLKLVGLLAGHSQPNLYFDGLGFERSETVKIGSLINNYAGQSLATYDAVVTSLFSEYEVIISEKFRKKYAHFFILGHLSAKDVLSEAASEWKDRTVEYVLEVIKRWQDREIAYKLLARDLNYFTGSKRFLNFLENLPMRGNDHLARIHRMLDLGVEPSLILSTEQRWQEALTSPSPFLKILALKRQALDLELTPDKSRFLENCALVLDNEKFDEEIDEASLYAVSHLLLHRSKSEAVNKSLAASAKHEDNIQIKYRASLAFLLNGFQSKSAIQTLLLYQHADDIDLEVRTIGNRFIVNNQEICTNHFKDEPQ